MFCLRPHFIALSSYPPTAGNIVRKTVPDTWGTTCEVALCKNSSHSGNVEYRYIRTGGTQLPWRPARLDYIAKVTWLMTAC